MVRSRGVGSVGSASSLGPGPGKRISLEAAMMDARIKARNSIFVTSGTNIIEGGSGPGIVSSERGEWGKSSEQAMMWKGSTSNHFPSYGSFS